MESNGNKALPSGRPRREQGLFLACFLFFWLVTCPAFGQGLPKQPVTEKDYHLWGNMYFEQISDYGNWISYTMQYDEHPDTLVVKSTNGSKIFKSVNAANGIFSGEKWFAAQRHDTLDIFDLKTGTTKEITGVESFAIASGGNTLVTIEKAGAEKMLCVSKTVGSTIEKVQGVTNFSMSPLGDAIAYQEGNKIIWQPLSGSRLSWEIATETNNVVSHLVWQKNGKSFAWVQKGTAENEIFLAVPENKHPRTELCTGKCIRVQQKWISL